MSRAEELAQAYADAVSTHRLESLYGTSKSYTLEKARERDEAHAALSAELRRLAAVEAELIALKKAIGDAEPWQWLKVRERWAAVCVDFEPDGTYKRHRVVWHNEEGWSTAEGQSIDSAIRAAIKEQT